MAENTAQSASNLCQSCGLCCTGLIFPFVSVSSKDAFVYDHPDLDLKFSGTNKKNMKLGCSFLDGTRCSIYENRPTKCQAYSCTLRRNVLNGSEASDSALGIIADLKGLIDTIDPLLEELSGAPFSKTNFRDFCHKFVKDASARLSASKALSASEQRFIPLAFEIIKIIDRYLVRANPLIINERLSSLCIPGPWRL